MNRFCDGPAAEQGRETMTATMVAKGWNTEMVHVDAPGVADLVPEPQYQWHRSSASPDPKLWRALPCKIPYDSQSDSSYLSDWWKYE